MSFSSIAFIRNKPCNSLLKLMCYVVFLFTCFKYLSRVFPASVSLNGCGSGQVQLQERDRAIKKSARLSLRRYELLLNVSKVNMSGIYCHR